MRLSQELHEYSIALTTYEGRHGLPYSLFKKPDHLAIRTASIAHFSDMVKSVVPKSEITAVTERDGKFLAAAKMLGSLNLGLYGKVGWIEIAEPDPDDTNKKAGLEYASFYFSEIDQAVNIFDRKNVDYEIEDEGEYTLANVRFMSNGREREFKITDTPIADKVAEDIANGDAHVLAA